MKTKRLLLLFLVVLTFFLSIACSSGSDSPAQNINSPNSSQSNQLTTTENPTLGTVAETSEIEHNEEPIQDEFENGNSSSSEIDIHNRVNNYRLSLGLEVLEYNETIASFARSHSQDMANGVVPVGHANFEDRANAIISTIGAIGVGENVAYIFGYNNPNEVAVEGWIASPGHEENMRGDYTHSGVGIATDSEGGIYYTHMFARVAEF